MPSHVCRGPWLKSVPVREWSWEEKLLNAVFIVKAELPWHIFADPFRIIELCMRLMETSSGRGEPLGLRSGRRLVEP